MTFRTGLRRQLLLVFFGAIALLAGGCTREDSPKIIRAAVTPASPPNLFEQDGKTVGMDLEIFEGYCKARGCTLQITAYDWQGMLGAVVAGKADVAFSAISITEKRKEVMDFSRPYLENTWNLVALSSRGLEIPDLSTLKRYSIGYPRGMAYTDFIRGELEPQGVYTIDRVKLYPSYNEVMTDLQNGNLDLAFLDGTVASVYRKKLPIRDAYVFSGFDRFGFAFPKGSKLREDFDRYLDELGQEKLNAITRKWLD